jgi:hypothetical protein
MTRWEGLKQAFTGRAINPPGPITVKFGVTDKRKESSAGKTTTELTWTDKRPHPANMSKYEELNKDPEVKTALNSLTDMTTGVGIYIQMSDQEKNPDHPHKKAIEDYCEKVNMDEVLWKAERQALGKGIAPLLKMDDGELKLLPAETFYRWQKPTGEDIRYTQEISGAIVSDWQGADMNKIILNINGESPTTPYGLALVDGMEDRLEQRADIAADVPHVIHKYGYPFRIFEADTDAIIDTVYTQATEREVDEDVFLGNVPAGTLRIHTETQDPRINFTPYIVHNDEQIAEGLMAPLMLYLRNATEASARTILESIDRRVQARQRYLKRRMERYVFKPLVGDPVPRLMWGAPKTGLEDINIMDVGDLAYKGVLTNSQAIDVLKKLGLPIAEITEPDGQDDVNLNKISESLTASLLVIERSFRDKRLSLTETLREGDRAIAAYVQRQRQKALRTLNEMAGIKVDKLSPANERVFDVLHNELFHGFKTKILPGSTEGRPDDQTVHVRFETQ